ncbi:GTP-binding protein [Pseudarthrobacter sp. NPDC092184]|uniref:GTP-binding protein n=1 Tax=unclassified Pseudarthrobacter TaxID=2647000 RepID=UPI0037F11A93
MNVRGVQLIRELAPYAVLAESDGDVCTGVHSLAEATGRSMPGSVQAAPESSTPFATWVHRVERPLHPERFRHALAALAEACCWLRGRLWVASAPDCRIAVQRIGSRVWLENTGPWQASRKSLPVVPNMPGAGLEDWHPEYGDRGTILAFTGDELDAAGIAELLNACELTEAEMAASEDSFPDPFGLNQTTETSERSSS